MKFLGFKRCVVLGWICLSFNQFSQVAIAATCIEQLEEQKNSLQDSRKHLFNSCLAAGSIAGTYGWEYLGKPYLKSAYPGTDILLDPICDSFEYMMYAFKSFTVANALRSALADYKTNQKYKNLVPLTSISFQAYSILSSKKDKLSTYHPFQIHFGKLDQHLTPQQKQLGKEAWRVLIGEIDQRIITHPTLVDALLSHLEYLREPREIASEKSSLKRKETSISTIELSSAVASIIYFADAHGLLCNNQIDYAEYTWDKIREQIKMEILAQTYFLRLSEQANTLNPYSSFKKRATPSRRREDSDFNSEHSQFPHGEFNRDSDPDEY
jgi:hypothetical protein